MSCGYHILSLQHKLDAAMSPVVCLNSLIWEGLSTLFSVGLEQSDWQLSSILGCIWRGLTLPWDRTRPWGLPGSLRLNTIDAWGDILWKQSWYLWTLHHKYVNINNKNKVGLVALNQNIKKCCFINEKLPILWKYWTIEISPPLVVLEAIDAWCFSDLDYQKGKLRDRKELWLTWIGRGKLPKKSKEEN